MITCHSLNQNQSSLMCSLFEPQARPNPTLFARLVYFHPSAWARTSDAGAYVPGPDDPRTGGLSGGGGLDGKLDHRGGQRQRRVHGQRRKQLPLERKQVLLLGGRQQGTVAIEGLISDIGIGKRSFQGSCS